MEFIAKGAITLTGVIFSIEADDIDEARQKAIDGAFERCWKHLSNMDDWTIDPSTIDGPLISRARTQPSKENSDD